MAKAKKNKHNYTVFIDATVSIEVVVEAESLVDALKKAEKLGPYDTVYGTKHVINDCKCKTTGVIR